MPLDEIEIREMAIDDLADVFNLGERLFKAGLWPALYRTWDEYEVVNFFASDTETCLVARLDNKLVGFALGSFIEKRRSAWRYGYIVWLGVDPDIKRSGIGSELFSAMKEKFIELGARMIFIDTDARNDAAINFFKKLGFDHENKHIYMSLNLTHHPEYKQHRKSSKKWRIKPEAQPPSPELKQHRKSSSKDQTDV